MKALVKFAAGEGNIDVLEVDEPRSARTWQRMMDIYARGTVRLHDLVSAELPISDWRTAFDLCADRKAFESSDVPD